MYLSKLLKCFASLNFKSILLNANGFFHIDNKKSKSSILIFAIYSLQNYFVPRQPPNAGAPIRLLTILMKSLRLIFLFQPHVPVRLPCYDFIPVIDLWLVETINFINTISIKKYWFCKINNLNLIKSKYPACDGRCVQNPSTNSPERADLLITSDSSFMKTSYSLQSENDKIYRFTLNYFIV